MATKRTNASPRGHTVTNCVIHNQAAPAAPEAVAALAELARASTAHAKAISDIADALKGTPATMKYGIYLANAEGDD